MTLQGGRWRSENRRFGQDGGLNGAPGWPASSRYYPSQTGRGPRDQVDPLGLAWFEPVKESPAAAKTVADTQAARQQGAQSARETDLHDGQLEGGSGQQGAISAWKPRQRLGLTGGFGHSYLFFAHRHGHYMDTVTIIRHGANRNFKHEPP